MRANGTNLAEYMVVRLNSANPIHLKRRINMKKSIEKKLVLSKETLVNLDSSELSAAKGGMVPYTGDCVRTWDTCAWWCY